MGLEQFEPTIIKLAKTYSIPSLEWEDIAQELRIHLWKQEKAQHKPIKSYKNWAYIACRHKIRDLARHYTSKELDIVSDVSDGGAFKDKLNEDIDVFWKLRRLEKRDREVADMIYRGYTRREIQKELKIGQHTIEKVLARLQRG